MYKPTTKPHILLLISERCVHTYKHFGDGLSVYMYIHIYTSLYHLFYLAFGFSGYGYDIKRLEINSAPPAHGLCLILQFRAI